jgi:hypothetical protein
MPYELGPFQTPTEVSFAFEDSLQSLPVVALHLVRGKKFTRFRASSSAQARASHTTTTGSTTVLTSTLQGAGFAAWSARFDEPDRDNYAVPFPTPSTGYAPMQTRVNTIVYGRVTDRARAITTYGPNQILAIDDDGGVVFGEGNYSSVSGLPDTSHLPDFVNLAAGAWTRFALYSESAFKGDVRLSGVCVDIGMMLTPIKNTRAPAFNNGSYCVDPERWFTSDSYTVLLGTTPKGYPDDTELVVDGNGVLLDPSYTSLGASLGGGDSYAWNTSQAYRDTLPFLIDNSDLDLDSTVDPAGTGDSFRTTLATATRMENHSLRYTEDGKAYDSHAAQVLDGYPSFQSVLVEDTRLHPFDLLQKASEALLSGSTSVLTDSNYVYDFSSGYVSLGTLICREYEYRSNPNYVAPREYTYNGQTFLTSAIGSEFYRVDRYILAPEFNWTSVDGGGGARMSGSPLVYQYDRSFDPDLYYLTASSLRAWETHYTIWPYKVSTIVPNSFGFDMYRTDHIVTNDQETYGTGYVRLEEASWRSRLHPTEDTYVVADFSPDLADGQSQPSHGYYYTATFYKAEVAQYAQVLRVPYGESATQVDFDDLLKLSPFYHKLLMGQIAGIPIVRDVSLGMSVSRAMTTEEIGRWAGVLPVSADYEVVEMTLSGDPDHVRCLKPPATMTLQQDVTFYDSPTPDASSTYWKIPIPPVNHVFDSPRPVQAQTASGTWSDRGRYNAYWISADTFAMVVRKNTGPLELFLQHEYDDGNTDITTMPPLLSTMYFVDFYHH